MLRGIEAPSGLVSVNEDPEIPADKKLQEIAASPVRVSGAENQSSLFVLSLPYTALSFFHINPPRLGKNILSSDYISVGDEELFKKGIGTRILSAAARYATELYPDIDKFWAEKVRLGMVNTAVRVFGQENVATIIDDQRFGWLGEKTLEEMFDYHPAEPGQKYVVDKLEAHIDRARLDNWEMPRLS